MTSRLMLEINMCPTIVKSTAPYPDLFPSQYTVYTPPSGD